MHADMIQAREDNKITIWIEAVHKEKAFEVKISVRFHLFLKKDETLRIFSHSFGSKSNQCLSHALALWKWFSSFFRLV